MNLFVTKFFHSFCSFFSGGILCDAVGILCGGTAIGVSGAIYREGHTFVLTHGVTADNAAGSLGPDGIICFIFSLISLKISLTGEKTHKILKSVHFEKTVAQSSFLSKALSFLLNLF